MPILTKWAIIGKLCQERTVIYVDEVYICELCQQAYEPEEVNGVRKLKTFKGYTVDLDLQQFRKIVYGKIFGERLDFVQFSSPKGLKLLDLMHEEVTR